jgi:hypothetical protein
MKKYRIEIPTDQLKEEIVKLFMRTIYVENSPN